MSGEHPSPAELTRFASGALADGRLTTLLAHLATCSRCNGDLGRALLRPGGPVAGPPASGPEASAPLRRYEAVVRRATARARAEWRRAEIENAGARRLLPKILAEPAERRAALVCSDSRLKTYSFARDLLTWSLSRGIDDPRTGEELGELALAVVGHLSTRRYGAAVLTDLQAEAWALIGNARRIRSAFPGATEALERAEAMRREGTGDLMEEALLASLRATHLRSTGQREEALGLVDHALGLYRRLGDRHLEGRTLIGKALALGDADALDEAIRTLDRAARLVDRSRDPRLASTLHQNRTVFVGLAETGAGVERALRALEREPSRGRLDRLRRTWAKALLLRRLERLDAAEHALLSARRGFADAAIPVDVALLDLDLAQLYLETGRAAEARKSSAAAVAALAYHGLQRQTRQAVELFRTAGGAA
jgi:tetratricopeptide (TPR) repeat protein